MRVFITGATGFIGSAVVEDLIQAGHQVLGLARSDGGAAQLRAAGAAVQQGTIDDLDALKRGTANADGVIHLAFNHDFTNFAASCVQDQLAIEVLGGALAGTNRPLVVTSGVLGLAVGRPGTEQDKPPITFPRKSETTGLQFVTQGVRAVVVRLSPSVHGDGDHGFVPQLINGARANGFVPYVGDGNNRWPAVHRRDAARLFRLALERGTAGSRYHGVGDEGIVLRDIATLIGTRLGIPAVSQSVEEVTAALGFVGHVMAIDAASSSKWTQAQLDWRPVERTLLEDLTDGTYFDPR